MRNKGIEIFSGWTKKSVTFTIDDGNIAYDTKFLGIIKPCGIHGTFNLCEPNRVTPDEYRALYRGYEIANHCKHHPLSFDEGQPFVVCGDETDLIHVNIQQLTRLFIRRRYPDFT